MKSVLRFNFWFLRCVVVVVVLGLINQPQVFPSSYSSNASKKKQSDNYQIQPGDRLDIKVYREEDLTGIYEVDPSGQLNFPLIGQTKGAGLSVEDLRTELTQKLKKYLVSPQIRISRTEGTIQSISLLGDIQSAGVYDYTPGITLMRLISRAGGFLDTANKKKIRIVRISDRKSVV